jgi:hypothetical protein
LVEMRRLLRIRNMLSAGLERYKHAPLAKRIGRCDSSTSGNVFVVSY